MELGAWVEFDHVAVREQTAIGSLPTTRQLSRTRRGMIIGERPVYDVINGNPPTLSNRRTVLLVAVSLHRTYRVFPNDARASTPPRPRRTRQARPQPAAPAALVTLANGGGTMTLTPVHPTDLEMMVADQLNQHIAVGQIFTAYDITQALRSAHPGSRIDHPEVRDTVHSHMETIIASNLYSRETASFGSENATRYVPQ